MITSLLLRSALLAAARRRQALLTWTWALAPWLGAALLALLAPAALLRAETSAASGAMEITAVPVVLSQPGTYFLARDFFTSLSSGVAIFIAADNVTLDFNGHTLATDAGAGNFAYAILSSDRNNLTVRHGRLSGFFCGVDLQDSSPLYDQTGGHLLEDMHLDRILQCGARLMGAGNTVRRCRAVRIGGTTSNNYIFGLWVAGPGGRVLESDVMGMTGGIGQYAIYLAPSPGAMAVDNRVNDALVGFVGTGEAIKIRDNLTATIGLAPYHYSCILFIL